MTVGRFCTRNVVTIRPDETVETAAQRMAEHNVGSLVVLDAHKPIGIVTDRDLVVRAVAKGLQADHTPVQQVMTPQPVCVPENAPLDSAVERMKSHRVRRLIVLDESNAVVGIMTLDDVLELLAEEREAFQAVTSVMRTLRHERL